MVDDDQFEPQLGRLRSRGGKRARSYLGRVLAATNLARNGAALLGRHRGFSGSRSGRGAGVGRLLASRGCAAAFSKRRVIVKTSIVNLAGKGAAGAAAHLRYLQRDGTTRAGEPGTLYGPDAEPTDGPAFRARGIGDRHQFRFIVSPEDGAQYDDLKPLTQRLMTRLEEDLVTKLDWVAVDHFNTGHPHTHIVVRGRDERGADLIIARDYLTRGIRERAAELIDLDLGPRSLREVETALRAEIDQDRLTSLDRGLLRGIGPDRVVVADGVGAVDQSLRAARLAKLGRLGLAEPLGAGRWRLAVGLDDTLRAMGERGDIVRTLQRALTAARVERAAAEMTIYDPTATGAAPLAGRVIERGLADEHADRHFLIVDATDGRSHYVAIGKGDAVAPVPAGAIVRIRPRAAEARAVDRTVAAVAAANHGRYDVDAHLRHDPGASQDFAEAHVRRLEALRRGGVELARDPAGVWTIAPDHLAQVAAYETARLRDRPVDVAIVSVIALDDLATADGATWLDREAVAAAPLPLRDAGFGRAVTAAQTQRRQWLVAQGLATESGGTVSYRPDLLAILQRRELLRVAGQLSAELELAFVEAAPGSRIDGHYRRAVDLVSGRFALIERAHDFTLVPWRPVLETRLGQPVSGIVREQGVNWSFGRGRGGPTIA